MAPGEFKLQETNCNLESEKVANQNILKEMQGLKSRNEEKDLVISNIKTKLEDKETDILNLQESLREIQFRVIVPFVLLSYICVYYIFKSS